MSVLRHFSERFFRFNPTYGPAMNRRRYFPRGRGPRQREDNRFRGEVQNFSNESGPSFDSDRGPKRLKPPPGLKGKEIGLWYRDRNRRREIKRVAICLDEGKVQEMENVLVTAGSAALKLVKSEDGELKKSFWKDRDYTFEEKLNAYKIINIKPDLDLDEELYNEWNSKLSHDENFKKMLKLRCKLPAFKKKEEIIDAIENNQVVVISGETGCGKTTQIVQFVLDDYLSKKKGSLFKAICTQPRRISAISVADRVATERGERLGTSVGYAIRLERKDPSRTRGTVTFVTTGILLQWLQSDPLIGHVSHLFIDEIHERDTLSDFLLALLKYILPKRPDLKVVLMSATLNSKKFSDYYGGVPCIHIPGFTYSVEEIYLEDILQKFPFHFGNPTSREKRNLDPNFTGYVIPYINDLELSKTIPPNIAELLRNPRSETLNIDLIFNVIYHICTHEDEGAILVFVPGLAQIQDLHKMLTSHRYFSQCKCLQWFYDKWTRNL